MLAFGKKFVCFANSKHCAKIHSCCLRLMGCGRNAFCPSLLTVDRNCSRCVFPYDTKQRACVIANLKVVSTHLRIIKKITRDLARRCQRAQLLLMNAMGASRSTSLMTYISSLRASSADEHCCLTYEVTHKL